MLQDILELQEHRLNTPFGSTKSFIIQWYPITLYLIWICK